MKKYLLSGYVMRSVLFAMLGAVVGLWVLQMVFAYLSELENISETYKLKDVWWFIIYRSPYFLIQFIPTGVLLGAVVGLGLLANNSELVVMRASGIGVYRIIGWAMIPAFLFVVISLAVNQFILPITNQKASDVASHTNDKKPIFVDGYWALTPDGNGGRHITYISYADNSGKLGLTKRYRLDENTNLTQMLSADGGKYQHHASGEYLWQLQNVRQIDIGVLGVKSTQDNDGQLALPIAPKDVHLLTAQADDLSLSDLYAHRQLMTKQGTRSLRHEVAFWQKLFSPFAVLSLVLVASSFVFGSLRSQGLGLRIVMALLTGLLFSYLTDLMGFVSLATGFSPIIMTFLPVVIGALSGVWLLNRR